MRQEGFTLAELAIVLVIIGLLVGSILKAQEMIVQAKIKNVIADFAGVSAAYYGYQDRYRAVPGDDVGAGRWPAAAPGDGNGLLAGAYNSAVPADESRQWWDHLRRAGFVSGAGSQQPSNALAGMLEPDTGEVHPGHGLRLGYYAQEHELLRDEDTVLFKVRREGAGNVCHLDRVSCFCTYVENAEVGERR